MNKPTLACSSEDWSLSKPLSYSVLDTIPKNMHMLSIIFQQSWTIIFQWISTWNHIHSLKSKYKESWLKTYHKLKSGSLLYPRCPKIRPGVEMEKIEFSSPGHRTSRPVTGQVDHELLSDSWRGVWIELEIFGFESAQTWPWVVVSPMTRWVSHVQGGGSGRRT